MDTQETKVQSERPAARDTVTPEEQARVLAIVQQQGMTAACKALQLDRHTIQRLLSPLPVRQQTVHWVRSRLMRL